MGLVILAMIIIIIVSICFVLDGRKQAKFENAFPPISDEEFVARCTPGTSPDVALRVRRIVADQLNVEYERIYPSSSFINDLGAD